MNPRSSSLSAYRTRSPQPKRSAARTVWIGLSVWLCAFVTLAAAVAQNGPHPPAGKEIRVAAAADLQTVLPALAQRYEYETGVKIVPSFGSSGTLSTQILNGAPFDMFLGADYTFPEKIVAANLAESRAAIPYAKGTLVLWARKDSPLQPLHLEALSDSRVKTVAIADELRAPYGRAAAAALTKLKLYDQLKPKFVVGENVAQTGQFVESGNADLGLISLTMATSDHFKQLGTYVLVPTMTYPEIRQCGVVLAKAEHRAEAHAFFEWLLSTPIQAELPKLGLNPVQ